MDPKSVPQIIDVDRLDNGLVIRFSDGQAAFYNALLLLEIFHRAEEMEKKAAADGLAGLAESS
jgi:hypothetical protein